MKEETGCNTFCFWQIDSCNFVHMIMHVKMHILSPFCVVFVCVLQLFCSCFLIFLLHLILEVSFKYYLKSSCLLVRWTETQMMNGSRLLLQTRNTLSCQINPAQDLTTSTLRLLVATEWMTKGLLIASRCGSRYFKENEHFLTLL